MKIWWKEADIEQVLVKFVTEHKIDTVSIAARAEKAWLLKREERALFLAGPSQVGVLRGAMFKHKSQYVRDILYALGLASLRHWIVRRTLS
ncbi:hypothetical protein HDU67_009789 [Dinochytrium kinnereticum]|nr:hypothetical protein HDU67_009789 [Dinochytrium kinnereticum]